MASAISFVYLCKPDFPHIARDIFDILENNMSRIAPTGLTWEENYRCWYGAVSEGLKKDPRQMVLIRDNGRLIGFFQYYTNSETFMMEELQLKPEYHGTGIFRALYAFVVPRIPEGIPYIEAYASTRNNKSIGILHRLGLKKVELNKTGRSWHLKGNYSDFLRWYQRQI